MTTTTTNWGSSQQLGKATNTNSSRRRITKSWSRVGKTRAFVVVAQSDGGGENKFNSGDVAPPKRKSVIYGVDDVGVVANTNTTTTTATITSSPPPSPLPVREEERATKATPAALKTANEETIPSKEEEEKSRKSANVIDLFERAASPIGTIERAKAALNAAQARAAVTSPIEIGKAKRILDDGLSTVRRNAEKTLNEMSKAAANVASGAGGTLRNAQKKAHSINHSIDIDDDANGDATGMDFWSWTPPERKKTDMALRYLNYRNKRKLESSRRCKSLNAASRRRSI